MKRLYIPLLLDQNNHKLDSRGAKIFLETETIRGYFNEAEAKTAAEQLAMGNPKGKVVMLQAISLIEPRKVEWAEKKYNDSGELIV